MALVTYADLQARIANTLNRDDLTADIPDFIALAEAEIRRDTKLISGVMHTTGSITTQSIARPTDLLYIKNFRLDLNTPRLLENVTPQYMDTLRTRSALLQDDPLYYAIDGTLLTFDRFLPTGSAYTLTYQASIPALSVSNTTNYFLTQAPDAYLYGALKHAAEFTYDEERMPIYDKLYQNAVMGLRMLNDDMELGQGPLVIRTKRPLP